VETGFAEQEFAEQRPVQWKENGIYFQRPNRIDRVPITGMIEQYYLPYLHDLPYLRVPSWPGRTFESGENYSIAASRQCLPATEIVRLATSERIRCDLGCALAGARSLGCYEMLQTLHSSTQVFARVRQVLSLTCPPIRPKIWPIIIG
jgi:hypothetical protein